MESAYSIIDDFLGERQAGADDHGCIHVEEGLQPKPLRKNGHAAGPMFLYNFNS